jgi:hypothetical protein
MRYGLHARTKQLLSWRQEGIGKGANFTKPMSERMYRRKYSAPDPQFIGQGSMFATFWLDGAPTITGAPWPPCHAGMQMGLIDSQGGA